MSRSEATRSERFFAWLLRRRLGGWAKAVVALAFLGLIFGAALVAGWFTVHYRSGHASGPDQPAPAWLYEVGLVVVLGSALLGGAAFAASPRREPGDREPPFGPMLGCAAWPLAIVGAIAGLTVAIVGSPDSDLHPQAVAYGLMPCIAVLCVRWTYGRPRATTAQRTGGTPRGSTPTTNRFTLRGSPTGALQRDENR